jgi:hypothetical protein
MDLFEDYENLPEKVSSLIKNFETARETTTNTYDLCFKLVTDLNSIGYTCEYGLDAEPFNLSVI